ncbi:GNAT family acetyltransferase [Ideonella margarita]|uniref:GNAT family acetyltransferase n=1 Tax=Ideonella margarita TaxID=2984191 RepID=A0ABU9C9J4_9BURK
MNVQIRPFAPADQGALIALWQACELTRPWNDPAKDIRRKLDVDPAGLGVAVDERGVLVGSVMVGYEGHRGWINYLAVAPQARRHGLGRQLMAWAEALLAARGCPKVNLQIRSENTAVQAFYAALGYTDDCVMSMGRRLESDL